MTSQSAVSCVKRLFLAAKAGHTGTLDPMASGLLAVCLGEATKFSHVLLDADKSYAANIALGTTTTTGDLEGAVTRSVAVDVERAAVERVLAGFLGEYLQTPPMYSALKHEGKALYRYARAGVTVERKPRAVRVHRLHLNSLEGSELAIDVTCSKGTYIRALAEDIGRALGCGACLSGLRRTAIGALTLTEACTLDRLGELDAAERTDHLRSVDTLVASLPRLDLDAEQARLVRNGRTIEAAFLPGLVRLYGPGRDYLGIATAEPDGRLVPKRLMSPPEKFAGRNGRGNPLPDIA